MDWFLYDNGLRHERVNYFAKSSIIDFWHGPKYDSVLKTHSQARDNFWQLKAI